MNREQLKTVLITEGFREDCYDLEHGGFEGETLCIAQEGARWSVYYSERGLQSDKKTFESESEACEYFLQWIRKDPSYRRIKPPASKP